jgi:ERCC4-type nuclease
MAGFWAGFATCFFLVVGVGVVATRVNDRSPGEFDSRDDLTAAWVNGEISDQVYQRALTQYATEETIALTRELQTINDIGPATAAEITREYPLPVALENATAAELEHEIHGVGASTARALKKVYPRPADRQLAEASTDD